LKKIIYSPGEPAGIGPDLIIQLALSKEWEALKVPVVVIGDPKLFGDRANKLKKRLKIVKLDNLEEIKKNKKSSIQIIKVSNCKNTNAGKLTTLNAQYVLDVLDYAIKKTIDNKDVALVTGPLNKETIISVSKTFTGHTEYIQKVTKSDDVLMMLASNKLRVALATTHIPLKSVPFFR
jgi:4-hydroxythreonine-4-phosphate dehydrogenase